MKMDKEQWVELLDDTFGPTENNPTTQDNTSNESTAEETKPEVRSTEDTAAPLEEATPRRKIRLWPFLTAAGLLVVIAVCVLIAYLNRPSPEVLRCKEALEALQGRDYYMIGQYTIKYAPIKTTIFESYYIQSGNDKSYSSADYGDWFRHEDTLFTHTLFRDGKTYTKQHYESEEYTFLQLTDDPTPIPSPWPLSFSWDAHNIQLVDQEKTNKDEEYFTFFVTAAEAGCDCCEVPFYTLLFSFFEGKLTAVTQTLTEVTGGGMNNYTENTFSFGYHSAEDCKESIDRIIVTP